MARWLLVLAGYIIGACPTAYLFGQRLKGKDIRQLGDGNMGARNAYHELGHKTGILIFFIDTAKGSLAVLLCILFHAPQYITLTAGAAAVAGHNWPVFLGFRTCRASCLGDYIPMSVKLPRSRRTGSFWFRARVAPS